MRDTFSVTVRGAHDVVISRVFASPRHQVYTCWAQPDRLTRWLCGPEGWTFARCEIDPRPWRAVPLRLA